MPTTRQIYKAISEIEKVDQSEGGYPIWFSSYWQKYKFAKYVQWRKFVERLKIWHLK